MIKELNIFFIYAPKCKHCKEMELVVESVIAKLNMTCNIKKLLYNNKTAIQIAIKYGINNLPRLVIGNTGEIFCGNDYDEKRITKAIQKALIVWKQKQKKV